MFVSCCVWEGGGRRAVIRGIRYRHGRGYRRCLDLGVLLVLLLAGRWHGLSLLLLMDNEASVALFSVPLKTGQVWCVELVVSLGDEKNTKSVEMHTGMR